MEPDALASTPLPEARLRPRLEAWLGSREPRPASAGSGTASAVLVALFERDGDTHVLLERRAGGMRNHSGQVAFPGGKRDPSDPSFVATALREAHEEVGLEPASVDVLGSLDDYVTVTGYVMTPVVGWISAGLVLVPSPAEVARIFSVPLRAFLVAPTASRAPLPELPRFLGYDLDGEFVWGATAAVARRLGGIVRGLLDQ